MSFLAMATYTYIYTAPELDSQLCCWYSYCDDAITIWNSSGYPLVLHFKIIISNTGKWPFRGHHIPNIHWAMDVTSLLARWTLPSRRR